MVSPSTDLGLFRGLSRRPRATRGPGGGFASTGGNAAAAFDRLSLFFGRSFFSLSILVGVWGASSVAAPWGAEILSTSFSMPSLPRVVVGGLVFVAVDQRDM